MSNDNVIALNRALEIVGEGVWAKLSDRTRASIICEELRILEAERAAGTPAHEDHWNSHQPSTALNG
jgi:hypothetical protein